MKKFFGLAVALLTAAVFTTSGSVAYASEQESLVIEVPDAYLEVEVPDVYDFVLSQNHCYRGDFESVGLDSEEMFDYVNDIHAIVYGLRFTGGYAVEAILYYKPELKPDVIKNLSAYSDKDLNDLSNAAASAAMTETKNYERVLASGDGGYRSPNGIAYYGIQGTYFEKSDEGTKARNAYTLYTFVNGEAYVVFVRCLDPDKDAIDYKEEAQAFVDGITFYNAPAEAELEEEKAAIAAANEASVQEDQEYQEDQENQDVDDMIANMYFMLGYAFVFIVIIAVIITVIVVNSSNKKKKQRMNMNNYYGNGYYNGNNNPMNRK